jgi:hypothetical protein
MPVTYSAALLRKIKTKKENCYPSYIAVRICEYQLSLSNAKCAFFSVVGHYFMCIIGLCLEYLEQIKTCVMLLLLSYRFQKSELWRWNHRLCGKQYKTHSKKCYIFLFCLRCSAQFEFEERNEMITESVSLILRLVIYALNKILCHSSGH